MHVASWVVLVLAVAGVGVAGLLARLGYLIPAGKVADEGRFLGPERPPVRPATDPAVELPVLPFHIWGLHFDEEIVVELADHPAWRMLEITRVLVEGREVWFTLDSHKCGRQWAGVTEESEPFAGGFPAPTHRTDLEAERIEDERAIRYRASWTLRTGERIEVRSQTRKPVKPPLLRNGNAMNHSQFTALAVIDLEAFRPSRVEVTLDGKPRRTVRLSRGLLVQSAAGLMEQTRTLAAAEAGGLTSRGGEGPTVSYARIDGDGEFELVAERPTATEHWRLVERDGASHVAEAWLVQQGSEVFRLRCNPPLPDLRGPVEAEVTCRMAASVNGRPGVMTAEVRVGPGEEEGTVAVRVEPLAPRWARARPVRTVIRHRGDGTATVTSTVEPTNPWSFDDVPCPD